MYCSRVRGLARPEHNGEENRQVMSSIMILFRFLFDNSCGVEQNRQMHL